MWLGRWIKKRAEIISWSRRWQGVSAVGSWEEAHWEEACIMLLYTLWLLHVNTWVSLTFYSLTCRVFKVKVKKGRPCHWNHQCNHKVSNSTKKSNQAHPNHKKADSLHFSSQIRENIIRNLEASKLKFNSPVHGKLLRISLSIIFWTTDNRSKGKQFLNHRTSEHIQP